MTLAACSSDSTETESPSEPPATQPQATETQAHNPTATQAPTATQEPGHDTPTAKPETPTQEPGGDTPTARPETPTQEPGGDTPTVKPPTPTPEPPTPTDPQGTVADTLYNRLGGHAGIEAVIGDFLGRVLGDPKINGYFLNSSVNPTRLSDCLVKQVGEAVGGPEVYDCASMADAHRGLGISTVDFTDLVTHLVDALDGAGVSGDDIATIGGVLTSQQMKDDIIEDADNNKTVYQRIGRKPAVKAAVDGLLTRVAGDTSLVGFFDTSEPALARLDTCLVRQVCSIDGPCIYGEGVEAELSNTACRDMASSHSGLTDSNDQSPITIDDFNGLVGHLVDELQSLSVPEGDINAILGALGPLCTDIVANPADCEAGPTPTPGSTLYQRLGEEAGITQVVNTFVDQVVGDPKINGYFLNSSVNPNRLKECLVKQIGEAVGGPQVYDCASMADAHRGLGISTLDFNDLVDHLVDVLTNAGVSGDDIAIIGGVLTSQQMKDDIIEDADNNKTVYQRVGRKPAVQVVISDFITRVAGDASLVGFFNTSEPALARLNTCLVRQVSSIDGPVKYGEGVESELANTPCRDMFTTHQGLTDAGDSSPITIDDFNGLVGHVVDALNEAGVTSDDIDILAGVLGPMCQDIVADPQSCPAVPTPTPGGEPTPTPAEPTVPDTLYNRLGGAQGINTVVVNFLDRVGADARINGYFLNSSLDGGRLKDCLVKQIGAVAGGPEVYDCASMVDAHAGLGISTHDFDDLVEDLVAELIEAGVSSGDIDLIGAVLTSQEMKEAIIEDPANDQSVYQRIGRKPAVKAAVDGFLTRVAGDTSLVGFFNTSEPALARLDTCLVRQVCSIDGPCLYGEGIEAELNGTACRDMASTHSGLTDSGDGSPITIDDFNGLVGHLVDELTDLSVPQGDIDAILGALGPLCTDIVANPADCAAPLATTDLIISEYTEPNGGNNKAIEIYNGTGATVNLQDYSIGKVTNGGTWAESTFTIASETLLPSGEVYVFCHSSAAFDPDPCDVKNSFFDFNGDDAMGLYHGTDRIDQVGDDGDDPGTGWAVAGVLDGTTNHSMLRKAVSSGNTNWAQSAGTDEGSSEWIIREWNDNADLGTAPASGPPFSHE